MNREQVLQRIRQRVTDTGENWSEAAEFVITRVKVSPEDDLEARRIGWGHIAHNYDRDLTTRRPSSRGHEKDREEQAEEQAKLVENYVDEVMDSLFGTIWRPLTRVFGGKPFSDLTIDELEELIESQRRTADGYLATAQFAEVAAGFCRREGAKRVRDLDPKFLTALMKEVPW